MTRAALGRYLYKCCFSYYDIDKHIHKHCICILFYN